MNYSDLARRALGICGTAAMLSGCSELQTPIGAPAATQQGRELAQSPAHVSTSNVMRAFAMTTRAGVVPALQRRGPSKIWTSPAAKTTQQLIYVSDLRNGAVEVYTYDKRKLLGSATGYEYPYGMCSDKKGDVYVTDFNAGTVSEFKMGTLKVIKTISGLSSYPIGCSVNPVNGDLAVTQFYGGYYGNGSVLIYPNATGNPTAHNFTEYTWPAGYDTNGNLLAEGVYGNCSNVCLEELTSGSSSFSSLTLSGFSINFPAAMEWDGKYLGVGDQDCDGTGQACIDQVSVSGSTTTLVNTVTLSGDCYSAYSDVVQWANDSTEPNDLPKTLDKQVAGGNLYCSGQFDKWTYPGGGVPVGHINGTNYPVGQVIVNAQWQGVSR